MKTPSYICPTSSRRLSLKTVRLTGFIMAVLIALFLWFKTPVVLMVVIFDYFLRGFTKVKHSPGSWLANQLARLLPGYDQAIDRAPKVFAAIVGFLFALTAMVSFYFSDLTSQIFAITLMVFALLEAVANICMGCLAYTFFFIHLVKNIK